MEIHPPNSLDPVSFFEVTVIGDGIFEPEKQFVVALVSPNQLRLPQPFKSVKITSPPGSMVKPPEDDRIINDLPSTKVIFGSGNRLQNCMLIRTCYIVHIILLLM